MNKNDSAFLELISAAKNMRDACNTLWHAHNPEDGPENTVALSVDEAQDLHSAAFERLQKAEHYAEKNLRGESLSVDDVKKAIGLEGVVLPCNLLDLIAGIAEQALAWQSLSHLADKNAPNLLIASNRLGREIESWRARSMGRP